MDIKEEARDKRCYCGTGPVSVCSYCVNQMLMTPEEMKAWKIPTLRDLRREKWERRKARYRGEHNGGKEVEMPKPKKKTPRTEIKAKTKGKKEGPSKLEQAITIYKEMTKNGRKPDRKEVKARFKAEVGLSEGGAHMYSYTVPERLKKATK